MLKGRRRQTLNQRASSYAQGKVRKGGVDPANEMGLSIGWEDGFKACLKEAQKRIREAGSDVGVEVWRWLQEISMNDALKVSLVIKNLNEPGQLVVIGQERNLRDAAAMQKRFLGLKWEQRREHVYTIGSIALSVDIGGERPQFMVLLEDDDGQENVEAPNGDKTFNSQEDAVAAAHAVLKGMRPGSMWASVFKLSYVETVRPK